MIARDDKVTLAYVIGVAMGDGNLSNPNGRAVRLRITCDRKYPFLIKKIKNSIKIVAPKNKISEIKRTDRASDISCYSNDWESVLGWKAQKGSKIKQNISIPRWIFTNKSYYKSCLCGLIETDGSIYKDRGYLTVNFTTFIAPLSKDVENILKKLKYQFSLHKTKNGKTERHTFRIHRDAKNLINDLKIQKK